LSVCCGDGLKAAIATFGIMGGGGSDKGHRRFLFLEL
jgi:hypothetical protein